MCQIHNTLNYVIRAIFFIEFYEWKNRYAQGLIGYFSIQILKFKLYWAKGSPSDF